MSIEHRLKERFEPICAAIYGEQVARTLTSQVAIAARDLLGADGGRREVQMWSERDVALITYGDQVRADGSTGLAALAQFLHERDFGEVLNTVHLLPFFPYSSDDGFSVIDYRVVAPQHGSWDDVRALGRDYRLMFDFVLNHVSAQSAWFAAYRRGEPPYSSFFIEEEAGRDYGLVYRPRTTPLFTPVETSRGPRAVWSTFGPDQIDLNFRSPELFAEMLRVLLFYVAQGARLVRLDALNYLWKERDTPCVDLAETHLVVRALRALIDAVAPGVLLLSETVVPYEENSLYFGGGDEVHLVYQFALAPLALDAMHTGDVTHLAEWAALSATAPAGCTFFNISATHDGIFLRPLAGLLPPERIAALTAKTEALGGSVSYRTGIRGDRVPHELNITLFSALEEPGLGTASAIERFLTVQALALALRGIPGLYFHNLLGTRNDVAGVAQSGRARTINRRKFTLAELHALLEDPTLPHGEILARVKQLIRVRIDQPAFHPDAAQTVVPLPLAGVLGLRRGTSSAGVLCLFNFTSSPVELSAEELGIARAARDTISGELSREGIWVIPPFGTRWLADA